MCVWCFILLKRISLFSFLFLFQFFQRKLYCTSVPYTMRRRKLLGVVWGGCATLCGVLAVKQTIQANTASCDDNSVLKTTTSIVNRALKVPTAILTTIVVDVEKKKKPSTSSSPSSDGGTGTSAFVLPEGKRLMTIQEFFSLRSVTSSLVSPNGNFIAFTVSTPSTLALDAVPSASKQQEKNKEQKKKSEEEEKKKKKKKEEEELGSVPTAVVVVAPQQPLPKELSQQQPPNPLQQHHHQDRHGSEGEEEVQGEAKGNGLHHHQHHIFSRFSPVNDDDGGRHCNMNEGDCGEENEGARARVELLLAEIDHSKQQLSNIRVVVSDETSTPSGLQWSKDSSHLYFLSKRANHNGGKHATIFSLAVSVVGGGEGMPLFKTSHGVRAFSVSPCRKKVAYTFLAPLPTKPKRDAERGFKQIVYDAPRQSVVLHVVDLEKSESKQILLPKNLSCPWTPKFDSSGQVLGIWLSQNSSMDDKVMNRHLAVIPLNAESPRVHLISPPPDRHFAWGKVDFFSFSPNSNHLALTATHDRCDSHAGSVYIAEIPKFVTEAKSNDNGNNNGAAVDVARGEDIPCVRLDLGVKEGDTIDCDWVKDGILCVLAAEGVRRSLFAYDIKNYRHNNKLSFADVLATHKKKNEESISTISPPKITIVQGDDTTTPAMRTFSASADGKVVVVKADTYQHPGEVFLIFPTVLNSSSAPPPTTPRKTSTPSSNKNKGSSNSLAPPPPPPPPPVVIRATDCNPFLSEIFFSPQSVLRYAARDGTTIETMFIPPVPRVGEENGNKKRPLIMLIHGGPESHYANGWINTYGNPVQLFAAMGFAVTTPNYRGSTGRGRDFLSASQRGDGYRAPSILYKENEDELCEFYDLVDLIGHLSSTRTDIDIERVGIAGSSYGGYAASWCATRLSRHFAAAVSLVGISNQVSKLFTTDIPTEALQAHWGNMTIEQSQDNNNSNKNSVDDDVFSASRDKMVKMLARSPVAFVHLRQTPLMIAHGQGDERVSSSQSVELYNAIQMQAGKFSHAPPFFTPPFAPPPPCRLVLYPGQGHGNTSLHARLDYSFRLLHWFKWFLQPEKLDNAPFQRRNEAPPVYIDYDNILRSNGDFFER